MAANWLLSNVVTHPPCTLDHPQSVNPCLPPVAPALPALLNGAPGVPKTLDDPLPPPRVNGGGTQLPVTMPTTPGDLPVPPALLPR